MLKKISLGADPELFLARKDTGSIISAIGRIGGKKETPLVLDKHPGFFFSEDNVTAEFAIPPTEDKETFVAAIAKGLSIIKNDIIDKKELKLSIIPSATFPAADLDNEDAQKIGCDPDWCVYTRKQNVPPSYHGVLSRAAGGHIHVGYPNPEILQTEIYIMNMDLFLAIPSIVLDKDKTRRQFYGKAGAFRIKDYGFEYRTLSNFWIKNKKFVEWAYNNTMLAIHFDKNLDDSMRQRIRTVVDTADVSAAKQIISEFSITMPGDKTDAGDVKQTIA